MRQIDIPAKVLGGSLDTAVPEAYWPYDDGQGDAFWSGGSSPRPYQWRVTISVEEQMHSSHKTRKPYRYTGMDVKVGDYVSNIDGTVFKIVGIEKKTDASVICIIEDELRYNTFRSPSGDGSSVLIYPISVLIFETNSYGNPVIDTIPSSGVNTTFMPHVVSRFNNLELSSNIILNKLNHGFEVGDLVSADPLTNSFVKTSADYPFLIGRVSNTDLGPNAFMVAPIQKVESTLDYLEGEVGQILYASMDGSGKLSTEGTIPYMMKLRDYTSSTVTGNVASPSTSPTSVIKINGVEVTIGGAGQTADIVDAINNTIEDHGISADTTQAATRVSTIWSQCMNGEPAWFLGSQPMTATINGVLVTFTTTTAGQALYGDNYGLEEDMVVDINAANIPNVVASNSGGYLHLTNTAGGEIVIVNGTPDGAGGNFAGPMSTSGVPLNTPASTEAYIRLTAPDARAIALLDVVGTPVDDCGLFSVENGVKAAGIVIEQGIRQAQTYYVTTIAHRDQLSVTVGDKAFVADKGNGEWGLYIYTGSVWVKISDADSAATDSNTVQVTARASDLESLSGVIHTVSGNSRVTSVVVSVEEEFDVPAYVIVGDAQNGSRLMAESQNDLMQSGDYQTNPSHVYVGEDDVEILFQVVAPEATVGIVTISITYA